MRERVVPLAIVLAGLVQLAASAIARPRALAVGYRRDEHSRPWRTAPLVRVELEPCRVLIRWPRKRRMIKRRARGCDGFSAADVNNSRHKSPLSCARKQGRAATAAPAIDTLAHRHNPVAITTVLADQVD
jgi:hypothetical protein